MSPFLTVFLGVFSAVMLGGSIFIKILLKFISTATDASIEKANNRQLEKIQEKFIPSMNSTLTGTEIGHIFQEMQEDIKELEASRKRHDDRNLELIRTWIIEIEKLKAKQDK